jgi:hypothetical protein
MRLYLEFEFASNSDMCAFDCIVLYHNEIQNNTLHSTSLNYIALHSTTLHYTTPHHTTHISEEGSDQSAGTYALPACPVLPAHCMAVEEHWPVEPELNSLDVNSVSARMQ